MEVEQARDRLARLKLALRDKQREGQGEHIGPTATVNSMKGRFVIMLLFRSLN